MPTIRQYTDATDRIQVIELWQQVFGYETAHNEPNLVISKKIAINDGLFFVAVELRPEIVRLALQFSLILFLFARAQPRRHS